MLVRPVNVRSGCPPATSQRIRARSPSRTGRACVGAEGDAIHRAAVPGKSATPAEGRPAGQVPQDQCGVSRAREGGAPPRFICLISIRTEGDALYICRCPRPTLALTLSVGEVRQHPLRLIGRIGQTVRCGERQR